jgi:hypothetical protein
MRFPDRSSKNALEEELARGGRSLRQVRGAARRGTRRHVRCPVYKLQGERYASLHQNRVVLGLSPKDAAQLIAEGGRTFEPFKGRPMQGRIVVPDVIVANTRALRTWIRKAARHARAPAAE